MWVCLIICDMLKAFQIVLASCQLMVVWSGSLPAGFYQTSLCPEKVPNLPVAFMDILCFSCD